MNETGHYLLGNVKESVKDCHTYKLRKQQDSLKSSLSFCWKHGLYGPSQIHLQDVHLVTGPVPVMLASGVLN